MVVKISLGKSKKKKKKIKKIRKILKAKLLKS